MQRERERENCIFLFSVHFTCISTRKKGHPILQWRAWDGASGDDLQLQRLPAGSVPLLIAQEGCKDVECVHIAGFASHMYLRFPMYLGSDASDRLRLGPYRSAMLQTIAMTFQRIVGVKAAMPGPNFQIIFLVLRNRLSWSKDVTVSSDGFSLRTKMQKHV